MIVNDSSLQTQAGLRGGLAHRICGRGGQRLSPLRVEIDADLPLPSCWHDLPEPGNRCCMSIQDIVRCNPGLFV